MRFVLLLLAAAGTVYGQKRSRLLDSVLRRTPLLKQVRTEHHKFHLQVIYTQIDRDENGKPHFVDHFWRADSSYFYCASLVKMPVSVFSLLKLREQNIAGLNPSTTMLTDSAGFCQKKTWKDSTSANGLPSVGNYVKRMLLVSDNDAYSRLLEFLHPDYLAKMLNACGYSDVRIYQRFDSDCLGRGNLVMNPVRFPDSTGNLLYRQPAETVLSFKSDSGKVVLGGKRGAKGSKDFTSSNFLRLGSAHSMLRRIIFDGDENTGKFRLDPVDRKMVMKYMKMYPRQSASPKFDTAVYFDAFKKYFIYGASEKHIREDSIMIFNFVGQSYGFLSDCAYIVDRRSGLEFMLSATLYCNERKKFGSGKYEYEKTGFPFLKELSLALYAYEKRRGRIFSADFSQLNFD
jgi:hypothetical protein